MTALFLRSNVRWNDDLGEFELRCETCAKRKQGGRYWPLTMEFWNPVSGMLRCRACLLDAKRRAERTRKVDKNASARAYYKANRRVLRMKSDAYYQEHRAERLAYMREYHEQNREQINAKKRARTVKSASELREYKRNWMRNYRARAA